MSIELITGAAGSGKTGAAIGKICKYDMLNWASQVRYVVPTTQMARQVQARILEHTGACGIFGNVVCTFYGFAGEFISKSGLGSMLISDVQKGLMLENLVHECRLNYLGKSSKYPGFIDALDAIIGELKISLITPEELQNALELCRDDLHPSSIQKMSELARLYASYQENILIKSDLHDREGLMWRALEIMKHENYLPNLKCVVFDGFGELNGVQREFLSSIASNVEDVAVTLGYEPNRSEVFDTLQSTHDFILELGASETVLGRSDSKTSSLNHLESTIFASSAVQAEADDSITIIEGGNPSIEIELVAQEICRLIRDGGCSFNDIAITARETQGYRNRIERIFDDYGIALEDVNHPLAETSIARLLVSCISIVKKSWHRDDVIRVLKSEMLEGDLMAACRAEVSAKQLGIINGRDNWLKSWGEDDLDCDFRNSVLKCVTDFEDSLQSAENTKAKADAVISLINAFKLRFEDDNALAQDCAAQASIKQIINDLLHAMDLINREMDTKAFLDLLESSISRGKYILRSASKECVKVLPASALGGQRFEAVFVVGLLEKVFPRQAREESFLRDYERSALNKYLNNALQIRLSQQSGERYLFYCAVGAAAEKLYLCYPLADEAAKDSLPSFYLDEARKLFSSKLLTIRRDVSDVVPSIDDAQTFASMQRSLVYALSQLPSNESQNAASVFNSLTNENIAKIAQIFRDCNDKDAAIENKRLLDHFASIEKTYRCTELEAYAACPFMHFCQSTLGLEPIREEIGGLDFGSILHETLYRLFNQLRSEKGDNLKVRELDLDATLNSASAILDEEFEKSSRLANMPAHERDMLLHNLRSYLKRYLSGEIKNGYADFVPSFFEMEFGNRPREDRNRDPRSVNNPLIIENEDGCRAAICGKMDRVDIHPDGALVIDYKLGNSAKITDFEKQLTFQAMVYSLALEKLFNLSPMGTEYRPLKKWGPDGYYVDSSGITKRNRVFSKEDFDQKLRDCEELVLSIVENIRAARIGAEPADCKSYCSFKSVCRIDDYKLLLLNQASESMD